MIPHSQKNISFPQDKKYGINKKYDITMPSSIESYTVYYVCQQNDDQYYVPVTKYINHKGNDVKKEEKKEEIREREIVNVYAKGIKYNDDVGEQMCICK